ncbi:MAG: hypothetical protein HPY57_15055 [Ignavibacteria bacterium]|nr:hypothetical protein [Ignavibacteria bacterium]
MLKGQQYEPIPSKHRENFNQNNLPANWLGLDFKEFSKEKSLFDYQQKALENALKAL